MSQPTRRILGPFNRVEGDLEVQVEVEQGRVTRAWVNSPLFRGFEQMLHGKEPMDALVYTPRICGICSVSQSVAAAQALAAAQGLQPCNNGELATNLILATENLADHLSHFYLFFMPDFARKEYSDQPWFDDISQRFKAQTGSAARQVLPARARLLHLTGILAGKWPHTLALQPGGTTRPIEAQERIRLSNILLQFRDFLQDVVFNDELEAVTALNSDAALREWQQTHAQSDFGRFLHVTDALELQTLGHATDRFLSYGAYRQGDQYLFQPGVWLEKHQALDEQAITEDISHSWLNVQREPRHPYHGCTIPDKEMAQGYSWCKAPRFNAQVVEVGAVSRQMLNGQPLIRDLIHTNGANVRSRVIARLLELARVMPAMEHWVSQLQIGEPFCLPSQLPDDAQGVGLVEAARGSLGHWLRIKNGRILNYQIIAPTTWNFSPRDGDENPGALELALQDTEVGELGEASVRIQHIIRSFDPCMVCTVH